MTEQRQAVWAGFRAGIPFAIAAGLLAISFGVLARPVMGTVAPIVMSAIVFAGSSQFAATPWSPGSCSTPATARWASRSLPRFVAGRCGGRRTGRR